MFGEGMGTTMLDVNPPGSMHSVNMMQHPDFISGYGQLDAIMDEHGLGQSNLSNKRSSMIAQWLISNYESEEGHSLPRQQVYENYEEFCRQNNQDPINNATFGKLIRAIFPNLKTRRLGTRGNSKYHYYGIRVRIGAGATVAPPLHSTLCDPPAEKRPTKKTSQSDRMLDMEPPHPHDPGYLGPSALSWGIPHLPHVDIMRLSPGLSAGSARDFVNAYHQHCAVMVDAVSKYDFNEAGDLLCEFWGAMAPRYIDLLTCPHIIDIVLGCDAATFEMMTHMLVPDPLAPMKGNQTKNIRNFSKNLVPWLSTGFRALGPSATGLYSSKVKVAEKFAKSLRRRTSLNHLANAARSVLCNPAQMAQMREDWGRMDFETVMTQAQQFCKCDPAVAQTLQDQFSQLLYQNTPIETWADWIDVTLDRYLGQRTEAEYAARARLFLSHWGFVSSLYIRDLTLRSAKSFGSFHLLRLLVDEYIVYVIESHTHGDVLVPAPERGMALGGYESTTSAHKRLSDEHDLGYDATKRFCQLSPRQTCTGSA